MSLRDDIARHEGLRLVPYRDTLGYWTIGYGHCISPNPQLLASEAEKRVAPLPWTKDRAEQQLDLDIAHTKLELFKQAPWIEQWPPQVQEALIEMAFQMGVGGVLQFRTMLSRLAAEDYDGARQAALDSRWATQTPERAQEVVEKFSSVVS